MRPLMLEFPDDRATWSLNDEWMLGDRITKGGERKVYLPAGEWFDGNTGKAVEGAQTLELTPVPLGVIPFYVRGGTILPLGPVIQSTAEAEDPLEVRIYPGADGTLRSTRTTVRPTRTRKGLSHASRCNGTTELAHSQSVIGKVNILEC